MIATRTSEELVTLADLVSGLGGIPLDRILFRPAPGTAVEQDIIELHDRENRLFELVDGVLVEKPMGFLESRIAVALIYVLESFVQTADLGIVVGADGMMRIATGLVRIPDVSVILWTRLPNRRIPTEPIPSLTADLAIEVLSVSNTPSEMDRKIGEYFEAGTLVVLTVDPPSRTVRVYSSPTDSKTLTGDDLVTADAVLPGFQVAVSDIFLRAGV